MVLVPRPSTEGLDRERREREFQIRRETSDAQRRLEREKAAAERRLWPGRPEDVAPAALDRVSRLAASERLQLVTLRPQRTNEAAGLTLVPTTVTVEGPFPRSMAFLRKLEAPENRLAVSSIQINSVDGASDRVSMTLGLVAFTRPAPEGGRR